MTTYAQIAYEAYAAHQGWKNYAGQPIPTWELVRADIQEAWAVAMDAVFAAQLESEGGDDDGSE